ncbi:TPA: hypothetical protein ACH3X1_002448 [Trebouxia sp. C0004]
MAAAAQAGVNAGTGHPATASAASSSNAPGKKECGEPFFVHFCQSSRPKFDCPSAWLLRNTVLDTLAYQVKAQQAKWMLDDSMAYHLTLSLDGWSNSRMESIYSWNIVFPDRRVMLLRSDDLSSMSHTGINLAELVIKEVKKWGLTGLLLLSLTMQQIWLPCVEMCCTPSNTWWNSGDAHWYSALLYSCPLLAVDKVIFCQ